MKTLMTMVALAAALGACEATTSYDQTTTNSARVDARRREYIPPSPSPVNGPMMNSYTPPPTLPEESVAPERARPPPGTSVVETVTPTAEKRDAKIRDDLRKAIQKDESLSSEAKQVEILVKNRKVILRGQARSERERMAIDSKARAADGVLDVDDQIQLVP